MTKTLETSAAADVGTPATAAQNEGGTPPAEGGESLPSRGEEAAPTAEVGSPFFADLVRAHYVWERELSGKNGTDSGRLDELDDAYHDKLREFRAAEGDILEVYWCIRKPSAVALTEKPRTRMERLVGEHRIRLHRVSNWLMPRAAEKLVDLLHDCEDLAIRAGEILRGTPKRIALRSTYEVESHVLAFLERTRGQPTEAEIDAFVEDARQAIQAAQECYRDAADKVARMVYVTGMLAGVAALPPLAALAGLAIWIFGALQLHSGETQAFFACLSAGALGAVVSVLSRMASPAKFGLDPEIGRRALFFLGIYRPLVGSIFGLALYFVLQSSLLQVEPSKKFATFVVAAFLGGFSERFVKVMLNDAEKSLAGGANAGGSK
jgi:hypothetical protein